MPSACLHCAADISDCHRLTRFCFDCATGACGRRQAHAAVARAVRRGELPRASSLAFADCGAVARDYDHRDYSRPLDVAAVCHRCNVRRGAALPDLARRPVIDVARAAREARAA